MGDPERNRVALFLPSLRGGGAERAMLNLARGLADRGLAVDMVLARAEGAYLSTVPAPVSVVDLGASRVLASLPALVRYLRQAGQNAGRSQIECGRALGKGTGWSTHTHCGERAE